MLTKLPRAFWSEIDPQDVILPVPVEIPEGSNVFGEIWQSRGMGDQVSERDGAVAQHERGGQIPVGAIVDTHNAVGHRFRQNEPSENFRYGTEPELGIAIGTLRGRSSSCRS